MGNEFYQLDSAERRRILADLGFSRNDLRVWEHPDGRAVGEGVMIALTDDAFYRFIGIEKPAIVYDDGDSILEIDEPTIEPAGLGNLTSD
ncbi:MAG: hypothetical protein AB7H86_08170 [Blastocatellales bacterium]